MKTSRAVAGSMRPVSDTRRRGDQRQPVELHALARDDLAALLVPVRRRNSRASRDRRRPPRSIRARSRAGAAREQPRRLDELGGEHPFRRLLREPRARMQEEPDAARAVVCPSSSRGSLHADVAEQPGEQRAMDRRVARGVDRRGQLRRPRPARLRRARARAARARRAIRACAETTRNARGTRRRACGATASAPSARRRIPTARSATGNPSARRGIAGAPGRPPALSRAAARADRAPTARSR